ncbi:MAG TPA: FkbM family methyltransferase [Crocinitomicaceae bacterium]|nr:FkbM family methyltransferase [Crocinitomicaceae bacterium]
MSPSFFRAIVYPLVTFRPTYLLGMVFVRLARKQKEKKVVSKRELVQIHNFMGSIKMEVDKNSYMGGTIYWCGFHHLSDLLYLRSFLKEDMTFVDVGANQGEFTLFAAKKLSKGKVIAFEPTPYQLGLLKKNILLNDFQNVDVNEYGLLDKEGEFNIYTTYETELHSGQHEGLSSIFKSETRQEVEATVQLKVFDEEYFDSLERLDFVKIDIEGAELPAMRGMVKTLKKFKPQLLIEMNKATFEDAGYSMQEVLDFLSELNYKPYNLYRGRIYAVESEKLKDLSNVIFK